MCHDPVIYCANKIEVLIENYMYNKKLYSISLYLLIITNHAIKCKNKLLADIQLFTLSDLSPIIVETLNLLNLILSPPISKWQYSNI